MHASTLRSLSDCFTTSANLQAGTQHNPGVLMIKHERNTPPKRGFAPGASCGQNSTLGLNNRGFLPNFKLASLESEAITCYVNLICSHTRLILFTSRESYVRVVRLGFGLDHVSLHMISLVPNLGPGCTACHLAELWGVYLGLSQ